MRVDEGRDGAELAHPQPEPHVVVAVLGAEGDHVALAVRLGGDSIEFAIFFHVENIQIGVCNSFKVEVNQDFDFCSQSIS